MSNLESGYKIEAVFSAWYANARSENKVKLGVLVKVLLSK